MNEKLKYDGESYKWSGTLNDLKRFVKEELDIEGNWSSPGGDAKLFRSINGGIVVKWHGSRSQKLVFRADNHERFLANKLKAFTNANQTSGASDLPEPDHSSADAAADGSVSLDEISFVQETDKQEHSTGSQSTIANSEMRGNIVSEGIKDETNCTLEVRDCDCNCVCRSLEPEIEDVKLDMVTLESRMSTIDSQNMLESELRSLRAKQKKMEAIICRQDETIRKLNEDNQFFKTQLISLTKTLNGTLNTIRNKDLSSSSAINIMDDSLFSTDESPTKLNIYQSSLTINKIPLSGDRLI